MLIFCSYRSSDIDQGSDSRRALQSVINEILRYQLGEKVSVERLTEDETKGFVNELYVENQFPSKFYNILHQRSGGNILFLTSLLENLVTQCKLSNSNGDWFVVEQLEDIEIPDSLENILKQRINNLPAELHNFCEIASVEGVEFTYEVVDELLQREFQQTKIQIGKQTQLLQQTFRIIVMSEEKVISPTQKLLTYSFVHGLLQETFYNNLPVRLKEMYHFFIGELLELHYSSALDEIMPHLALHFLRGKQPKRAAKYFYRAASNNRLLSAIAEADFNLSNAIQLLEAITGNNDADQGLLADCCQMLGHVRGTAIGQFDNGISLYQRALDIRRNLSNQGEYLVDCLHMMGVCYSASNRYINARNHFTRALQLLRRLEKGERTIFDTNRQSPMGNPIGLLKERRGNILRDIGHTYQNEGNLDKAIPFFKQSLRLLENGRDDGGFSDTLYFLGLAYLDNKDHEKAKELFSQALEIRKRDKLFAHQVMIYRSMSDLAFSEGKDNEGFNFAIRARDLCKEYEFHFREAEVLRFLSDKYLNRHNFTEAFQSLAEAAMLPYFSNFDEYKETLNTIIDKIENFQETGRNQLAIYFCEILIEHAHRYSSRQGIIEFANKWMQVKEFLETPKPGKTLRDLIVF